MKNYLYLCCVLLPLSLKGVTCQPNIINPIGSFLTGGTQPFRLDFNSTGRLLAVVNLGSSNVSMFKVKSNGTLERVGAVVPTGSIGNPTGIAFNSDDSLVATANGDDTVTLYNVAQDGSLTANPLFTYSGGGILVEPAFSPDGNFLALSHVSDKVVMLRVMDTTLTEVGDFAAGSTPAGIAYSPDGSLLAVTNSGGASVSIYTTASDGTLTAVPGSPFLTIGTIPTNLAFSPDGTLLVTSNSGTNNITVFSVAANGALTQIGVPFTIDGTSPNDLCFTPDGSMIAISNGTSNDISLVSITAEGFVQRVPGSPFGLTDPRGIACSPGGNFIATADFTDNSAVMFCIQNGLTGLSRALRHKYEPICTNIQ